MKFVICSFLFIVLIVDNRAEDSEEGEFSDLEDFADWELDDEPPTNKAKSMHVRNNNCQFFHSFCQILLQSS